MSQSPLGHRSSGNRCPPVPISRGGPPARWPIVAAAGAFAGLFLVLLTLTAWVSDRSSADPPQLWPDTEVAIPEVAQEMPPPPKNIPELPLQAAPPPADHLAAAAVAGEPPAEQAPQASVLPVAAAEGDPAPLIPVVEQVCPPSNTFGTTVDFLSSPTEAAQKAEKAGKLLFVLHISGNFEDDKFT